MKSILQKALCLVALLSMHAMASDSPFRVMFDYSEFYLPSSPKLALLVGGEDDSTIFKYSDEKGKKYIGISFMSKDKELDAKCPPPVYLHEVYVGTKKSNCPQDSIYGFRSAFILDAENGVWEGGEHKVYYSIMKDKSHLFIVRPDKRAIHIDSDFLDKNALQALLSKYI